MPALRNDGKGSLDVGEYALFARLGAFSAAINGGSGMAVPFDKTLESPGNIPLKKGRTSKRAQR